MAVIKKDYVIEMLDGSRWAIPVEIIANDRAEQYKNEFNGSFEESLQKDTIPLFEEDHFEIADWAKNNMNWSDIKQYARCVGYPKIDWEEGWANGEYYID